MSWGGFSGGYGGNASAYSYRGAGGPFSSSSGYGRGVGLGSAGSYRGGSGLGLRGAGGTSYGGLNTSSSPNATSVNTSGGSSNTAPSTGTESPRVAIIGLTPAAFSNWWAMHAAGLQVRVVVGVGDATKCVAGKTDGTATAARLSTEPERSAAAEPARAFAQRCTRYFHLPHRTAAAPSATTTASPSATPSPGTTTSTEPTAATTPAASAAAATTDALTAEMPVRVCVKEDSTSGTETINASTASTSSLAPSPTAVSLPAIAGAGSDAAKPEESVIVTSWGWFFKPHLDPSEADAQQGNAAAASTTT